jgi:hypothetical protein
MVNFVKYGKMPKEFADMLISVVESSACACLVMFIPTATITMMPLQQLNPPLISTSRWVYMIIHTTFTHTSNKGIEGVGDVINVLTM